MIACGRECFEISLISLNDSIRFERQLIVFFLCWFCCSDM
jgi:hypothetical protein